MFSLFCPLNTIKNTICFMTHRKTKGYAAAPAACIRNLLKRQSKLAGKD